MFKARICLSGTGSLWLYWQTATHLANHTIIVLEKIIYWHICFGIQIYCIWDYYLIKIKISEIPHYLPVSLLVYICRSYAQRFQVYHPPPLRSACEYMWGWNVFILSKRRYRSGYRPGKHVQEMHQEGRDYY